MSGYNNNTAILAVNSLDRYTVQKPGTLANLDVALQDLYYNSSGPPNYRKVAQGNNFLLTYPGALIYGYIKSIAISQTQIEYRIPTVCPPNGSISSGNQFLPMVNVTTNLYQLITIPFGFYTPDELAAMLTILIRTYQVGNPQFTVTYVNSGGQLNPANININGNCFIFQSNNGDSFYFPDLVTIRTFPSGAGITEFIWTGILKCYRLLGITVRNSSLAPYTGQILQETQSPNFLFTSYIDICSNNLTKYQKIKDTDTSVNKRQSLIARIYLSGVGLADPTRDNYSLGCQPFIMTADLNTPKTCRWSVDEAVYELDFQLYDQYGDLIYWDNIFPTEFQMTLLATEGEE